MEELGGRAACSRGTQPGASRLGQAWSVGGLEAGDCAPDKPREMEVVEGSPECQALGRHHLFQISPMREVSPQLQKSSLSKDARGHRDSGAD